MVLKRSTIQLLRFHFSLFLLPVYLFALSQLPDINWSRAIFVFAILHLLVYPSSNGYNSYMDRDETPIGGLSAPLQPTSELFYTSVVLDILSISLSLFISYYFAVGILLYILASRAYSYRGIRLKRYPITGFLTVFIFQGALIFYLTYYVVNPLQDPNVPILPCLISSLLIGALYPLTQIYQHEEDRKDGVTTISSLLGKKGSCIFCLILFLSATLLMWLRFYKKEELNFFYLFILMMLPTVLFFLYWMKRIWQNGAEANFRNSFLMNLISTLCTSLFFITLIILKH